LKTALVLSGGGARGAYQVGVLRGLVELGVLPVGRSGFPILVGSSAGALNAGAIATFSDRFAYGVERLEGVWRDIQPDQVFRTDLRSLGSIGFRWVRDLSFGGALRGVRAKSLLDTAPLAELLSRRLSLDRLDGILEEGALEALAVLATDLHTSSGVVFLQAGPGLPSWSRQRWRVERTRIGVEHLMASSAIPVFFPSIEIGGRYYGDGCIRNTAPLSPAINLGADRIVAIGVRGPARDEGKGTRPHSAPSIAEIAGVLLDAVMLDAIEVDVEHSERVNCSVLACPTGDPENPFRWIDVLWIRPSQSCGDIAAQLSDRIPPIIRYLMRGLGPDEATTELASYLLFDSVFCGRLLELGRADVHAERARIADFFEGRKPARSVTG
jgi:NTE family protein